MAKGNLFLGQARGKIGDIVLTRTGGEQVSRPRNRHPRNPQTPAQMFQRGSLATVSEMYIRGTRNFFKYAFSNKTAAQSEFNKFCQLNIGRVPCSSKTALAAGAPAIGNFIMTQGSLQSIRIEKAVSSFIIRMRSNVAAGAFATWTVGDISRAFIETFGYQQGDIITYLDISSPAVPYSTVASMIENGGLTSVAGVPMWNIRQFRLNIESADLASSLGCFADGSSDNVLQLLTTYNIDADAVEGVCMVCSRNVKSGVLVSTSEMICNNPTQIAIDLGLSDAWKEAVARFWVPTSESDIAPVNILQGSLSVPQPPVPETNYVVATNPSLPAEATSLTVQTSFSLGSSAGSPGLIIGHVDINGVQTDIEVVAAGSSVTIEVGALSTEWSRGSHEFTLTNSSALLFENFVINVDLSN